MHALIIVAHPDPASLTHALAANVAEGVSASGHTSGIADLAREGFDPRFTRTDVAVHLREAPVPADVAAEQARIDRADALVLVFPVYWWSMPGLLKGWIDRVFTNGWAYDSSAETGLVKRLRRLRVHLVGLGGADARTFDKHGYRDAMRAQIEHGMFDYCGACVSTSTLLLDSHVQDPTVHLEAALGIGRDLFDAPGCALMEAA